MGRHFAVVVLGAALSVAVLGPGVSIAHDGALRPGGDSPASAAAAAPVTAPGACGATLPPHRGHYVGLVAHHFPGTSTWITKFTRATAVKPNMITYYQPVGTPFNATVACQVIGRGAMPFIQIEPWPPASLKAIVAGQWDNHLTAYADAVKAYGDPIALGFGHEMNGTWYPWGRGHVSAALFVAAFRHVHNVFAAAGADNVTWVWSISHSHLPVRKFWPGSQYVNWVGISGYYVMPSTTWNYLFRHAVDEVRTITDDPILISETAVQPGPRRTKQVANLFAGMRAHRGILGFVWFDIDKRYLWRIETSPAAVAVFRKDAPAYMKLSR